ncbi:hypothetical protein D3C72_1557000 [compost metagenome]
MVQAEGPGLWRQLLRPGHAAVLHEQRLCVVQRLLHVAQHEQHRRGVVLWRQPGAADGLVQLPRRARKELGRRHRDGQLPRLAHLDGAGRGFGRGLHLASAPHPPGCREVGRRQEALRHRHEQELRHRSPAPLAPGQRHGLHLQRGGQYPHVEAEPESGRDGLREQRVERLQRARRAGARRREPGLPHAKSRAHDGGAL